jgi:hypothetical protein
MQTTQIQFNRIRMRLLGLEVGTITWKSLESSIMSKIHSGIYGVQTRSI